MTTFIFGFHFHEKCLGLIAEAEVVRVADEVSTPSSAANRWSCYIVKWYRENILTSPGSILQEEEALTIHID